MSYLLTVNIDDHIYQRTFTGSYDDAMIETEFYLNHLRSYDDVAYDALSHSYTLEEVA